MGDEKWVNYRLLWLNRTKDNWLKRLSRRKLRKPEKQPKKQPKPKKLKKKKKLKLPPPPPPALRLSKNPRLIISGCRNEPLAVIYISSCVFFFFNPVWNQKPI